MRHASNISISTVRKTETDNVSSLCSWWITSKEDTIPSICHWFGTRTDRHDKGGARSATDVGMTVIEHSGNSSISILLILAAVFFILFIAAITIWVRRKRYKDKIEKLKQKDEPPDYVAVLKMIKTEDACLPTYAEAILIETSCDHFEGNSLKIKSDQ